MRLLLRSTTLTPRRRLKQNRSRQFWQILSGSGCHRSFTVLCSLGNNMRGADKKGSRFRINISYFYCRKYLFNRASQVRFNESQASTTAGRVREASRATSFVKEIRLHIETHRLRLRPVMAEDVVDLYRIYGDPATNTFNPAGP